MANESRMGKIAQVIGPVVDVAFELEDLPNIYDALEIPLANGSKLVCRHRVGVATMR
jgi:F-type H+-transporting ATPase subunit beta